MKEIRPKDQLARNPKETTQTNQNTEEEIVNSQPDAEKAAIGPEILSYPDDEEDSSFEGDVDLSYPDDEEDPGAESDGGLACADYDEPIDGDCGSPI